MDVMLIVWFCAIVFFVLLETLTMHLVSIWFTGGALAALILTFINLPEYVQCIVFFIVSATLLFGLRPFAKRWLNVKKTRTNSDRNIDKVAMVTENIDNTAGTGTVFIDGKVWTARSFSGLPIAKNTLVRIMLIEGVKLIVQVEDDSNDDTIIKEKVEVR